MITNKAALLVTLVLCLVTFSAQINSAQAEPLPKQGGDKDNSTREEKTHQVPLPRQIDDDENFVVIISIDGFPASALWNKQVAVPVIRELAEKGDRKSTRLNSSHVAISYAVFCLKKKILAIPGMWC